MPDLAEEQPRRRRLGSVRPAGVASQRLRIRKAARRQDESESLILGRLGLELERGSQDLRLPHYDSDSHLGTKPRPAYRELQVEDGLGLGSQRQLQVLGRKLS